MKKILVTGYLPKQKANIQKKTLTIQKLKSKASTNSVKNENIPKKIAPDMDEAVLHLDKQMPKIKVSSNDQADAEAIKVLTAEGDAPIYLEKFQKAIEDDEKSKMLPIKNTNNLKMKVNTRSLKTETIKQTVNNHSKINNHVLNSEVKNVILSNPNDIESLKVELENINNYMEQLINNKLKTFTTELSNEKSSIVLINSVTAALDKYQNPELEQKTREGFSYKEKLDTTTKELENVTIEKNDILKRLEESEVALANANEKIHVLLEKTEEGEYDEKIKEIEDERLEWSAYQIQLENQITEDHKALTRKEQYVEHQDYLIDNLTQEKLDLESRLNKPLLQSHQSEEMKNYQNEIRQLSACIAETKKTLAVTKESHKMEMSEMRDRLRELEKLIVTKNDLIHQQNMTLNLLRTITPETNDNSIMKHRWP